MTVMSPLAGDSTSFVVLLPKGPFRLPGQIPRKQLHIRWCHPDQPECSGNILLGHQNGNAWKLALHPHHSPCHLNMHWLTSGWMPKLRCSLVDGPLVMHNPFLLADGSVWKQLVHSLERGRYCARQFLQLAVDNQGSMLLHILRNLLVDLVYVPPGIWVELCFHPVPTAHISGRHPFLPDRSEVL